jgi:hypothetical protein
MTFSSTGRAVAALALLSSLWGCAKEEEILTHGYVKLELRRGESQASNPYVGTSTVVATMQYRECLDNFYGSNPDLRQTGVEGETIFGGEDLGGEGWADRLCEAGTESQMAECTIAGIDQKLDQVKQLTVTYAITGEAENRVLLFGPLPTKETAGCLDPIVRVAANGAISGNDGSGNKIWVTESFSPTEAITGQGGAIVVRAAREM